MEIALQKAREWINSQYMSEKMDGVVSEALEALATYSTKEMRHNVLAGIFRNVAVSAFEQAYVTGFAQGSANYSRAEGEDHATYL